MVEVQLNTPLAEALNMAIQPKLSELGWGSGGADDTALAEYIVLMLVNGKTQDEITTELSSDFLQLSPDDPSAKQFVQWLFEQIEALNAQLNGAGAQPQPESAAPEGAQEDYAMDDTSMADAQGDIQPPTGPKSMRGGNNFRGGREKRMMGQINRTLNHSNDSVLHRTRGQSGVQRGPPTGPRMGVGRQARVPNNRAATVGHGLAQQGVPGFAPGPGPRNAMQPGMNNGWGLMPQQPTQMDVFALLEQQQQMIAQMMAQQAGMLPNGQPANNKSLFERVQKPPYNNFRGRGGARGGHHNGHHNNGQDSNNSNEHISQPIKTEGSGEKADTDMTSGPAPQLNQEEIMCKFNLACTNRDCKFAHQSPAAPPGITVDVKDVCTFGAACKNRKCVGRHPSPAAKSAHQSEQDCKFYPNCTNPRCPFRHPAMPPCRNGGECKVPNCKFTHVKTQCRFRPCTNRFCPFSHEEGQRGTFHDKVWVAGGGGPGEDKEHVSERKFVDDSVPEETVLPDSEMGGAAAAGGAAGGEAQDVVV